MKMDSVKQFFQSAILLILLTIFSVRHTSYPYICILSAGLLLVVFGIRSVSEKQTIGLMLILAVLSAVFAYSCGYWIGFLIFLEFRTENMKFIRTIFPGMFYVIGGMIIWNKEIPEVIAGIFILTAISIVIIFMEIFVFQYLSAMEQTAEAVRVTAVNEMYEKKLNQELVMKNYLADRNARLEERETISRNIHNSVGHSITAAIMTLDAADMLFDSVPDKAREKMNTANERIRESLNAIRYAVRVLDIENQYISMDDFIRQLMNILDNFVMDTQIRLHMDFSETDKSQVISHSYSEFLTGAVQEFLANGIRHGNADTFTIIGITDSTHIQICVCDNGNSDFSTENQPIRIKNGFGLKKIEAYVKRCGGTVSFTNENGFKSVLVLPIYSEEGDTVS